MEQREALAANDDCKIDADLFELSREWPQLPNIVKRAVRKLLRRTTCTPRMIPIHQREHPGSIKTNHRMSDFPSRGDFSPSSVVTLKYHLGSLCIN